MKIILISGKAMHGKDSSALLIKQRLESKNKKVLITHMADLLKYECKQFFNWDGNKDDYGRSLLQRIGTDVIRAKNPDYWVNFIKNFLEMFQGEWDYVLIPDVRFKNEIESFKIDGWPNISVRIIRTNFESTLTDEQKNHPSETALDDFEFDYYLVSPSGLEELESAVDEFIKWLEV